MSCTLIVKPAGFLKTGMVHLCMNEFTGAITESYFLENEHSNMEINRFTVAACTVAA